MFNPPSGQNRQKNGTQNTVPCCRIYTPTDSFFGQARIQTMWKL